MRPTFQKSTKTFSKISAMDGGFYCCMAYIIAFPTCVVYTNNIFAYTTYVRYKCYGITLLLISLDLEP